VVPIACYNVTLLLMTSHTEKIRELIEKRAVNNRLPCPAARRIAKELSVSYKEVGRTADEMNVKITDCELGCF
jgi:hypothetical protein